MRRFVMTYKAIDIANWFIEQFDKNAGDVITHLKLQKLLYFAEAWTQLLLDRELFDENIEAWAHGPVVREVFNEFQGAGWQPLTASSDIIDFDKDVTGVLEQVLDAYGNVSAKTLEYMTHSDRPWIEARGALAPEARCSNIISKESIKDFFVEKYKDALDA